jgi:hypothetical protein
LSLIECESPSKWRAVLFIVVMCLTSPIARAGSEITALEMRQKCRGIEAARLNGENLLLETGKYPDALTCWGAFSTLHQQSLWVDSSARLNPIFLPGVCAITNGHGQKAVVLVKVFTHYVDEHPQEAGKDFMEVAWEAFKAVWPCVE